jgi:hypothetical protein
MKKPTESYLRVNYELRPAKQVERRMIIDALQMLSLAGFQIRDYQYTGFGSVYFVDFVLFHKLLGIKDMLNVEYSLSAEKRVIFNKPFDFVRIEMSPVGDVIPKLSADKQHFLWLDYDHAICQEDLQDIWLAAAQLSRGSILLITVDTKPEPKGGKDEPKTWMEHFRVEAGKYLGHVTGVSDFAFSKLPKLNAKIIERAIASGLAGREVKFLPLFNFLYADGSSHMLTVGGVIGADEERRRISGSRLQDDGYYVRSDLSIEPYRIVVPKVTRKERLYLDSAMPGNEKWKPREFDMQAEDLQAYREIYRFFPAYAELLL